MKLTTKEKYWLAGFIDGDGCISIRHFNPVMIKKPFKCKIYSHIRPCIEIGNTNKKIIQYISKLLDTNFRTVHRKNNYKNFYVITLESQKAGKFLKFIHNSLKIRKKQAELCLKLLKTFKIHKRTTKGRFRKLNKQTIQKRWDLYKQCKILNYRGKLNNKKIFLKNLDKNLKELLGENK